MELTTRLNRGNMMANNSLPAHDQLRSVAVIGAGIAGLTCAGVLTNHGFEVTLFDKASGPGGRTCTRRVEPDLAFDHGAQYFTARTPEFAQFVDALKAGGCIADWIGLIVKLDNSVVTDTSPQSRFVGVPGMSAVATFLAEDLTICHEVRIDRIGHTEGVWELTDETGRQYGPFDLLVLSLPAPQAAVLLGPHPFAAEVSGVIMAPCWAAVVAFEDRLEVPWDGAFVSESPLSWVARNSSKPGRSNGADCWVLHASPAWSAAFLDDSPDVVVSQLLVAFEAAVGCSFPKVKYLAAHRWRYSMGADLADRGVLFDPEAGLAVCGDWLCGGRIEGAYRSGTFAAECVLREFSISK